MSFLPCASPTKTCICDTNGGSTYLFTNYELEQLFSYTMGGRHMILYLRSALASLRLAYSKVLL